MDSRHPANSTASSSRASGSSNSFLSSTSASSSSTATDQDGVDLSVRSAADLGYAVAAAAETQEDGRIGVEISLPPGSKYLSNLSALGVPRFPKPTEKKVQDDKDIKNREIQAVAEHGYEGENPAQTGKKAKQKYRRMKEREDAILPPMSIVIFIVGSRGGSVSVFRRYTG